MIYTKKGDEGETIKFDGSSVSKDDLLIEVLGSLDETSSFLGLCIVKAEGFDIKISDISFSNILEKVQYNLFLIQSVVAGKEMQKLDLEIKGIESTIDWLETKLLPLNKFLKTGGNELALLLNYERTLIRKAERRTVALFKKDSLKNKYSNKKKILAYLNRLSDLFFVLYRFVNINSGHKEEYF